MAATKSQRRAREYSYYFNFDSLNYKMYDIFYCGTKLEMNKN